MYLGLDFGTSGVRAIATDRQGQIAAQTRCSYDLTKIAAWQEAMGRVIRELPEQIRADLVAIAIAGTSGTVLISDARGLPICEPLIYSDARGMAVLEQLRAIAPADHITLSATSSLAKLRWLLQHLDFSWQHHYFLHQADWLAYLFHGQLGISDYHNALKLGYDPLLLSYPQWLDDQDFRVLLPQVYAPGEAIAPIQPQVAQDFGINPTCRICAGTTDSTAAFLATGAEELGAAVTALGSTLVLKILHHAPIYNPRFGVYSHRWGDRWLVGGASNTGGAVLRQFFTDEQLESLSAEILANMLNTPYADLDYYPLLRSGERFPIYNPQLQPRLTPRPDSDQEFLYGLLGAIARIEAQGYQLLHQLGANFPTKVYTTGGGAKNLLWQAIRAKHLPVVSSAQTEAAYGAAILARMGDRP